jgi:hypothetical protein
LLAITQIHNKKINAIQLYKCHSKQQLKSYFNTKYYTRNWVHNCNHRCFYCHSDNFHVCISLPLIWSDIVYFVGSFCSWECCKQYALQSSSSVYKKSISLIGYFRTILKHSNSNLEIHRLLEKKGIGFKIVHDWDYQNVIEYVQSFAHSNHLYSSTTKHLDPVIYCKKRKKSTLTSLIQN